jgi:GntR family transcriptional regulator
LHEFKITPSSGVPIYKQLFSQIERMVLNSYLKSGEHLPSVRQVASDLEVNPMTVSKAYGLLEERGYLVRLRGKGMVVADRSEEVSTKEKLTMLKKIIDELLAQAKEMGIDEQTAVKLVSDGSQEQTLNGKDN